MIKKYTFGKPFVTQSVIKEINAQKSKPDYGECKTASGFEYIYKLKKDDIVYGLGQTMAGINIRGGKFVSWCLDQPEQEETTQSLYGAHNFIIIFGQETFGLFIDYPGEITFDIGNTDPDLLKIECEIPSLNFYQITSEDKKNSLKDLVRQLRGLTGSSYIPPKWAFGFCQSRWGYKNQKDIEEVIENYKSEGIPLDSVCLDIDYMKDYMDFTVDSKKFPKFKEFNSRLKKDGIRLVPIIDAGVKYKKGYKICDELLKQKLACTEKNGKEFITGVWPGDSLLPDFMNEKTRLYFGMQYKTLTDLGIEGFWNDMNEPAMFYSKKGLDNAFKKLEKYRSKELDITTFFEFTGISAGTFNQKSDTQLFYHKIPTSLAGNFADTKPDKDDNVLVQNKKIHNLYGFNMARSAALGFSKTDSSQRKLLYSRSSFIGSHRYAGIWTGDNHSYWSNILLSLHMMASLNMTGFLYSGSDIGGFNADCTQDLMQRWMAFGLFTPLFRNHSAAGSRRQELYQYKEIQSLKSMVELRYALIPYLYSEFVKAALTDGMYFKPLAFDYQEDKRTYQIEDQLMLGNEIMLAPIYTKNARGRYVYLPETMIMITWKNGKITRQTKLKKGDHYIEVNLDEVTFFVKDKSLVPLVKPVENTQKIDLSQIEFIGNGKSYELYEDDGFTTDIRLEGRIRKLHR